MSEWTEADVTAFIARRKQKNSGIVNSAITKKSKPAKFKNKKVMIDGIWFDSLGEGRRYQELILLEKSGTISTLQLQRKFEVIPKQIGERKTEYIADFVYMENGRMIVEDYKSDFTRKNPAYVMKRKLMKLQSLGWYEFREVMR